MSGYTTRIPVRRLWGAVLCGYLCLGATLQALPTFVTQRFHVGALIAGTAVGIAFAATACTRPFAGRAADAGRARPAVIVGGLLVAAGGLGHLWAPDVPVLLLSRLVMGAGEAALFSGAIPWVLSGTPPERRGRVTGWFGLSMWGGLALGPVLAVALYAWAGFTSVWYGVIALGVASSLLVTATPRQPSDAGRPPLRPGAWRDLVPAGVPLPGLVLGLSSYGYGTVSALLILFLRHDSLGGENAALALFALAFLLVRGLGSPLVDRWGGSRVAVWSLAVESAGLLLIATAPRELAALAGAAAAGAGVALMFPSCVAITLRRTAALRPGTSVGAMTSFWDLGIMVAGPLGGLIAGDGGYRAAFALAIVTVLAGIALVAGVLGVRVQPRSDRVPEAEMTRTP